MGNQKSKSGTGSAQGKMSNVMTVTVTRIIVHGSLVISLCLVFSFPAHAVGLDIPNEPHAAGMENASNAELRDKQGDVLVTAAIGALAIVGVTVYEVVTLPFKAAIKLKEILLNKHDKRSRDWAELMYASLAGDTNTVKSIISKQVNLNEKSDAGLTPLMLAASRGNSEIVSLLISSGAEINARSKEGYSALILASGNEHAETVKELINLGADVNSKTNGGVTSLMLSAAKNNLEISKALLLASTDVKAKDKDGITALHIAAHNGYRELVKTLMSSGAEINAKDEEGRTPLMLAAIEGHEETVKILVESGADVLAKDIKGDTVTTLAHKGQASRGGTESKVLSKVGFQVTIIGSGTVVVNQIIHGSAAQVAGLRVGDEILQIDNTPIHTFALTDVYLKFYGPDGKRLSLKIRRPNSDNPIDIVYVCGAFMDDASVK